MAKERLEVEMVLTFKSVKAAKALIKLADILVELYEDFSYREDIPRAIRLARFILKEVKPVLQEDIEKLKTLKETQE
jgi:6-pyruvoyl-tetrahydropterin synthase